MPWHSSTLRRPKRDGSAGHGRARASAKRRHSSGSESARSLRYVAQVIPCKRAQGPLIGSIIQPAVRSNSGIRRHGIVTAIAKDVLWVDFTQRVAHRRGRPTAHEGVFSISPLKSNLGPLPYKGLRTRSLLISTSGGMEAWR
jgi:hypothetical protein